MTILMENVKILSTIRVGMEPVKIPREASPVLVRIDTIKEKKKHSAKHVLKDLNQQDNINHAKISTNAEKLPVVVESVKI